MAMRGTLAWLLLRMGAVVLILAAVVAAGCDDAIPAVGPSVVDSAAVEDAAERVDGAADRIDRTAERLEAAATPNASESGAIIVNAEALRLLALLSQLAIEIRIIDALIDPLADSRPRDWPLEPEDGAALGFASSRLAWLELQLSGFVGSLAESPSVFGDEQILPALVELQAELARIERSAYVLWEAHDGGDPAAPGIRRSTVAQTRIDGLIEAVGAFLATDRTGAAVIPGAMWNAVNALERLGWAARGNCSVLGCQGGHGYPVDFRRRAFLVYSVAEFRSASIEARGYSSDGLDDAHCGRSVADGRFALGEVSYVWSLYASRFRAAGFDYPRDGLNLNLSTRSVLSPSSLYRRALLACTLRVAIGAG